LINPKMVNDERWYPEYERLIREKEDQVKKLQSEIERLKKEEKMFISTLTIVCPTCDGTREERYTDAAGSMDTRECKTCKGYGRIGDIKCNQCGNTITSKMVSLRRSDSPKCPWCGGRVMSGNKKYLDEDWPVNPEIYLKESDERFDFMIDDMTWGQLFGMFRQRNADRNIDDYRPSNESYKFQIWLKDGSTKYVKYHKDRDEFELSDVTDGGYLKWDSR